MDTSTNEGITSFQYAGFWRRFWATLLDSLLLIAISFPILYSIYGADYFLSESTYHGPADIIITYVFPLIATVLFWRYKSATPGKMALKLHVVDADTGNRLSNTQAIVRYFAYIISALPLGLGFFWIAWDKKKQGWHDKLARTVVVRP